MEVKILIFLVFCVGFSLAKPQFTWEEFVDILEHVPKHEKYDFIHDNYLRGYQIIYKYHMPYEKLSEQGKFSVAVVKVITKDLNKSAETFKHLLERRDVICFPLPIGCIDPSDSGLRP